jgi:ferredoxin
MVVISPGLELQIAGHLGEFTVTLMAKEQRTINVTQAFDAEFTHYDLIVDLSITPLLQWEVLPLGYYPIDDNGEALDRLLEELPDMIGEFEKATFFRYDAAICAHGRRGLKGCTRCLETCPTGAISSLRDMIAVDPYLCQGGGSCATACPSGAIIYTFPTPADTLEHLRTLLYTYRDAGGEGPILLFHSAQTDFLPSPGQLPGQLIPVHVEEVGSVGIEIWLASLAYGASRVLIGDAPQVPESVRHEIRTQLTTAQILLAGMGYPATALDFLPISKNPAAAVQDYLHASEPMPAIQPAGFATSNAKRDTLHYALDALAAQGSSHQLCISLPSHAPLGEIQVDREACTLCMACVAVCPASALFDGGDAPRLEFLEQKCLQCGLCETACPEDAITLHPRFLLDAESRRRRRTLNEDAVFACITCGKPFATQSLIDTMTTKLTGHPMFQDEAALKRLQMCGDCRVKDMFASH